MTDPADGFDQALVRALRDAAPYLLAHRGASAVVILPGNLLDQPQLYAWLGDITLLQQTAGMRFALAYDALPQAARSAAGGGAPAAGIAPVSAAQLAQLRRAAHEARDLLESCLARGAPGHLAGAGTVAGNLLAARRAGVVDGRDMQLMGVAKTIDAPRAGALLATGKIVILPPLGVAADGQILHLDATAVALEFAAAARAAKLVVLAPSADFAALGFRELTLAEAESALAAGRFAGGAARLVAAGVAALARGVRRVHILDAQQPGGLLLELLSPNGIAAMISIDRFDAVRAARPEDAAGIIELIAPGVAAGAILPRVIDDVAGTIDRFAVVARDEALVACGSLQHFGAAAELGCLAVRPDYANQAYGKLIVDYFAAAAKRQGATELVAVTTQAADWFGELGFVPADGAQLPPQRLKHARARGAKLLAKRLADG